MRGKTPILFHVIFGIAFSCFFSTAHGQGFMLGIKFSGLAIHPKYNKNAAIYKGKVDRNGYLVINKGITLTADVFLYRAFGIKLSQTLLFSDCAGKFASLSHVGINVGGPGYRIGNSKHAVSASIGPMFFLRRTWYGVPGYVRDNYWLIESADGKWARKLAWIGGQLEYNYYFNEHQGISANLLPALPDVLHISAGMGFR